MQQLSLLLQWVQPVRMLLLSTQNFDTNTVNACRNLTANTEVASSSDQAQASSFLGFAGIDMAAAVAAACQNTVYKNKGASQSSRLPAIDASSSGVPVEFSWDRNIPLASWTGTSLGPDLR